MSACISATASSACRPELVFVAHRAYLVGNINCLYGLSGMRLLLGTTGQYRSMFAEYPADVAAFGRGWPRREREACMYVVLWKRALLGCRLWAIPAKYYEAVRRYNSTYVAFLGLAAVSVIHVRCTCVRVRRAAG